MPYEMGSARGRKKFTGENSLPPTSLRYGGESVCIAHVVCGKLNDPLPAFLKLSTLVSDMEELKVWLTQLCKVCNIDPLRSVEETLEKNNMTGLLSTLPPKRVDELCFEFSV